jgi:rare lipoprotein A
MYKNYIRYLYCAVMVLIPALFCAAQEERGEATWYESESPELSASHANLPMGSRIRVINLENDRQAELVVNRRIPHSEERILELSQAAARELDMLDAESVPVIIESPALGGGYLARETPSAAVPAGPSGTPSPAAASSALRPVSASLPSEANVRVTVNVNGREQVLEFSGAGAPSGGTSYRLQLGAYTRLEFAQDCYNRLKSAGFSPAIEQYGRYNRVVIPSVAQADLDRLSRRLNAAGFREIWIRKE